MVEQGTPYALPLESRSHLHTPKYDNATVSREANSSNQTAVQPRDECSVSFRNTAAVTHSLVKLANLRQPSSADSIDFKRTHELPILYHTFCQGRLLADSSRW